VPTISEFFDWLLDDSILALVLLAIARTVFRGLREYRQQRPGRSSPSASGQPRPDAAEPPAVAQGQAPAAEERPALPRWQDLLEDLEWLFGDDLGDADKRPSDEIGRERVETAPANEPPVVADRPPASALPETDGEGRSRAADPDLPDRNEPPAWVVPDLPAAGGEGEGLLEGAGVIEGGPAPGLHEEPDVPATLHRPGAGIAALPGERAAAQVLRSIPDVRLAVLWAEVLSAPRSLRPWRPGGHHSPLR